MLWSLRVSGDRIPIMPLATRERPLSRVGRAGRGPYLPLVLRFRIAERATTPGFLFALALTGAYTVQGGR